MPPASRFRFLEDPRARQLAVALAATALIAVLAALLYAWFEANRASERAALEAASKARAEDYAGKLARLLTPYRRELAALEKDGGLASLILSGDRDRLALEEQRIARALPGILRVRLLPVGVTAEDTSTRPPLTFASLDMMRRAENDNSPVAAEAQLTGTADAHIVVIGRARGVDGKLAGFVHLSIDPALVVTGLAELSAPGDHLEVQQPVTGGAPSVIAVTETAIAPGRVPAARVPVPGTRWSVLFWPDVGAAAAPSGAVFGITWIHGAAAAVMVLALALVAVSMRARRPAQAVKAGKIEATVYAGAVEAIMLGRHPGLERLVPGLDGVVAPAPARPTSELLEAIAKKAQAHTAPNAQPEVEEVIDFSLLEEQAAEVEAAQSRPRVPLGIFRPYDIRGIVDESLTEDVVYALGRAIGSEGAVVGQAGFVVARDGRASSQAYADALIKGLEDSGREVIDIGLAPAPVLYFATHFLDIRSGVMVTGSHNAPEYNGFKIVMDGEDFCGDRITALRERIERQEFISGAGSVQQAEIVTEYVRRVSEDIPVALGNPLKIVVDCGNAVSGVVAPSLLRTLGHDVIELFCDVDGAFPNHHPDPSQPENLVQLVYKVLEEEADLGLAFDGDGDRLGVVDSTGNIIWPDRQLMLFARDVLARNVGAEVVYDVKCSRHLASVIAQAGGKPVMWKTGRSFVKARMKQGSAPLAGEFSGHFFFKERWFGFDDAFYAAARLVEILGNDGRPPAEVFSSLPDAVATPELRIELPPERTQAIMEALIARAAFDEPVALSTIDGLRADLPYGFGLVRPSNTSPALVMRFEGDDEAALHRVQEHFRSLLRVAAPDLKLPF